MKRLGFTIVELIIVITVMGILITLAVVNVNSSQVRARDNERKTDVEAIALAFETGTPNIGASEAQDFSQSGYYPGTSFVSIIIQTDDIKWLLPDLDPKALRAPGVGDDQPISLVAATNAVQSTSGVQPQPTINTYVYQAINQSGLCAYDGCRSFNIYYRQESDNSVQVIKSRRQ